MRGSSLADWAGEVEPGLTLEAVPVARENPPPLVSRELRGPDAELASSLW